jgi:hypothetical protein
MGSAGRYRLEVDEMADHHMVSANSLQNILLAELDDDRKLVGAANANGDLFYRGVNGNLCRRTFPIGGASTETDTGVPIAGVASVTEGGPNAIDVFARDSTTVWGENNLIHYYLPVGQSTWTREWLPAFMMSDPGVFSGGGVVDVAVLGPDGSLYHWSSVTQVLEVVSTNPFFGPPAVVRTATALHIFVRGKDSSTYHFWQPAGGSWAMQPLPMVLSGFPTAGTCGQVLCVAGLGTDSTARLGSIDATGVWSGWSNLSASAGLRGTPSLGSTTGTVPLYVSTVGGTLGRFVQAASGGPWTFTDLHDVTVASPTAIEAAGAAQAGTQMPASTTQMATTGSQTPASTGQTPAAGSQTPASTGQTPAAGSQTPGSTGQTPATGTSSTSPPPAIGGAVISGGQSGALWIHRGATAKLGGWFD